MYIPKTKFIYPTQSDTHMLHVTPEYHDVLDKNYDLIILRLQQVYSMHP